MLSNSCFYGQLLLKWYNYSPGPILWLAGQAWQNSNSCFHYQLLLNWYKYSLLWLAGQAWQNSNSYFYRQLASSASVRSCFIRCLLLQSAIAIYSSCSKLLLSAIVLKVACSFCQLLLNIRQAASVRSCCKCCLLLESPLAIKAYSCFWPLLL